MSNSRSALQAIIKCNNSHIIVQKILKGLHESGTSFRMCWVPRHVGVQMSGAADHLLELQLIKALPPQNHQDNTLK